MIASTTLESQGIPGSVVRLTPGGMHSLAHLSDKQVLEGTRQLVGRSNQLLAALLVHLAEVETRGLHRTRACASLYTYCIYELRFSEDEAARRAGAAKLVKKLPVLFDSIANGELHLTGLLMLGPHLTAENHADVLTRAKFRTKKEIAKLVRDLAPLPQVPEVMDPLGPERRALRNPTWEQFVASLCPPVRELRPGERPKDWANDGAEDATELGQSPAPARVGLDAPVAATPQLPPLTPPQQYHVQFSAFEEHVKLVERAKQLLAREVPGIGLAELHLQAMKLFVAALEKEKLGAGRKVRRGDEKMKRDAAPSEDPAADPDPEPHPKRSEVESPSKPRPTHSRYIPAAVRRAVVERDEARCTYVDDKGTRCRETCFLELHHLVPFASGGENVVQNLTLRCAAHNALAAEEDFGPERIRLAREGGRHESLRRQGTEGSDVRIGISERS